MLEDLQVSMTKTRLHIDSITTLLMCLYSIFVYVVYVNSALEAVHSIVLYAFFGMAIISSFVKMKIQINKYLIWYLGFVFLSMLSLLYTPRNNGSIYDVIVVFCITFAMSSIMTSQRRMEIFMRCLIIGSVILMVNLIVTGQTDIDTDIGERLGSELTGNANVFACIYMVAACSSVYFIMSRPKLWQKAVYLLTLVLQMYALILSGGRKYPIVPLLVWFFIILLKTDKKGKKHIVVYSIIGITIAIVFYYLMINVSFLYESIGHRFESLVEYILGVSQTSDASTIEREQMRQKAFELWGEAPFFGHGYNAFSTIGGFGVYCHCNYLELLCNHGIVVFAYYYGFLIYLLWHIYRAKQNTLMRLFVGGMLIGLLIYDYGAISYNTPITHFFILMASIFIESPEETFEEFEKIDTKRRVVFRR